MNQRPNTHKNVLLICSDEFRGDMLAANGMNPDIRTPHLDALAGRGVNFQRHFCALPKCVPSRVSMMTGRYPHTDGFRTIQQHLPLGTPDLASTLKSHGYELAEFGRNHCWEHMLAASHRPPQLKPGQQGLAFDHHAWTPPFGEIWHRHRDRAAQGEKWTPDALELGGGLVHRLDQPAPADAAVTEMARLYLGEVRDASRPFFCQVNLGKPHPPYEVEEPWFSMYDRDAMACFPHDVPSDAPLCVDRQRAVRTGYDCPSGAFQALQSTYMSMCTRVDEFVGQIIDAVDRAGLWDDTVVLFLSDHGDYAGQYGLREKWDTHFSDCLMHVPMLMAGGGLPERRSVTELTSHVDLAPSICALLDVPPFEGIHGTSMLPAIDGQPTRTAVFADGGHEAGMRKRFNAYDAKGQPTPTATPDSFVAMPQASGRHGDDKQETYRLFPDTMARAKMVRTQRWKYVHRETGDHELYDLAADRWEMTNLFPNAHASAEHRDAVSDLRSAMLDWSLRTDPDRPHQPIVSA